MCDYSLQHLLNRPAKVGDALMTKQFGTGSGGLVARDDIDGMTAVCLRPGTELVFDVGVVAYIKPRWWLGMSRATLKQKTARFRQLDTALDYTHRDALEFADGTIIKLTRLVPGQAVTVIQLPVSVVEPEEPHEDDLVDALAFALGLT